jgi:CheY-like chemotaxis protein
MGRLFRLYSIFYSVKIVVTDTGRGMSGEQATNIFKLFTDNLNDTSCLGEGLILCKRTVDALGGNIALISCKENIGSVFEINSNLEREKSIQQTIACAPVSLLMVEDSKTSRSVFRKYCLGHDVKVEMAENGQEGWAKYLQDSYDALIIDCYMPKKDGFALVKDIREHEEENNLKRKMIFALTGDPSDNDRAKCKAAGFDDFLTKPYKMDTVQYILERVSTANRAQGIKGNSCTYLNPVAA